MQDDMEFPLTDISIEDLTWREQEILLLLADRLTNKEISSRLHLAETTVKDYVSKILSKLYVKNRRQAVERARSLGLLEQAVRVEPHQTKPLPVPATPFVGRPDELQKTKDLLANSRLVTVTGPGGIGKTRLVLEVAAAVQNDFSNGVYFVSLTPVASIDLIVYAVAEAIGFPLSTQDEPLVQLLNHLSSKHLLLVLDNFEHLVNGAVIVSNILSVASGIRILTTSRERLNIQGETLFNLRGLSVPVNLENENLLSYDAVKLFIQCARRILPSFEPAQEAQRSIINICMMVQGMPLAIELAAAWLNVLTLDEIIEDLENSFRILESQWHDVPERHRSVQTVIDHSWARMDLDEREMYMRLSVFEDGFSRRAAEQITQGNLKTLVSLVNKSVIRHNPDTGRFEMHELLRQYGQYQLDTDPKRSLDAYSLHAAFYAELMQDLWLHLKDSRQIAALSELEADLENIRSAWGWLITHRNASQLRKFMFSFWIFYWVHGWHRGGMELYGDATQALSDIPNDEEAKEALALALAFQAFFASWLGLAEQGLELVEKSISILEQIDSSVDEALIAALNSLHITSRYLNRIIIEDETVNRLLNTCERFNDPWWRGFSLFASGTYQLRLNEYDRAREYAQLCYQIFDEVGDSIGKTLSLSVLGHAAQETEEFEAARSYYQRYYDTAERTNFRWAMANALKYLGVATFNLNDIKRAEGYFIQSLRIAKETGSVREMVSLVVEIANIIAAKGQLEEAVSLYVLVIEHPVSLQDKRGRASIRETTQKIVDGFVTELSPENYDAAIKRGQNLQLDITVGNLLSTYDK